MPDPFMNNDRKRLVLIGKTGAGKSAAGNTILGGKHFESKMRSKSLTKNCKKVLGDVCGEKVLVLDTPGLCDTHTDEKNTNEEIKQCVYMSAPGPHVFLVVIKVGRYTDEEKKTVDMIKRIFGNDAVKYTMILFTHGDQLDDGDTIEDWLSDDVDLKLLLKNCNGNMHVFNNKDSDHSQAEELMKKVNAMVARNGGSHYTNEMFQEAERELKREEDKILKGKEEENNNLVAKLTKQYADNEEVLHKKLADLAKIWNQSKDDARNKVIQEKFTGIGAEICVGDVKVGARVGFWH